MRVGVIGAGAIGCLFGAMLSKSGNDVILVHRNRGVISRIKKAGVFVRELNGNTLRIEVPISLAPADLSNRDLVIITVKAYDTSEAASQHRGRLRRGSTILTLQNGLGNVETISKILRNHPVLAGTTSEGSLLLKPGHVVHTGGGRTWVGKPNGDPSNEVLAVVREFNRAGFATRASDNIGGVIWSKTIVNAAINPVSALTGLRNGEISAVSGLKHVMLDVVKEGVAVSQAEKVLLEPDPRSWVFQILRKTSKNNSSMLQDVKRKKRTEIWQLNGAICGRGVRRGIPTPVNQILTFLVSGVETGWQD